MASIAEKVAHVKSAPGRKGHVCHATNCEKAVKPVKPAYCMCPRHWRMVPREVQVRVWREYRIGQEAGAARVTEAYLAAMRDAIAAVELAEART